MIPLNTVVLSTSRMTQTGLILTVPFDFTVPLTGSYTTYDFPPSYVWAPQNLVNHFKNRMDSAFGSSFKSFNQTLTSAAPSSTSRLGINAMTYVSYTLVNAQPIPPLLQPTSSVGQCKRNQYTIYILTCSFASLIDNIIQMLVFRSFHLGLYGTME